MSKLKERMAAKVRKGCEFMDQRDKGEFKDLENSQVTLEDAYLIEGEDGEYYAFTVKEYPENFFFSNIVLTDIINEAQDIANEEHTTLKEQIEGVVIKIGERTASQKRKGKSYFPVEII